MVEKVDIIVLGATGFIGKCVVKELALINKESDYLGLTWGIAGRSREKLKLSLTELEREGVNTSKLPVLECDIADEQALKQTCRSAKVLMNCTGPCSEYSEPIVKACIETKTHYVDISTEVPHMLKIQRTYHDAAKETNVLIIPACGFVSIPVVMGLMHLEKHFQGTLETVECYMEIEIPKRAFFPGRNNCVAHYRTWESIVQFKFKSLSENSNVKKEAFAEPIYGQESEEIKKSLLHRKEGKCWFPYPGPDRDIVDMTQRYLHEKTGKKPIHFKIYATMPLSLLLVLILTVPFFFCYYWLYYFKCFKYLFSRYPKFFTFGYMSHEGPDEGMINDTKFSFVFTGTGWQKDEAGLQQTKKITLKVSGSDPRYKTTVSPFVLSAITILKDGSVMPTGGVLTTGVAFRDTPLVDRLNARNVNFEFV